MNELDRWTGGLFDDMLGSWGRFDPYLPWLTWKVTDLAPKNYVVTETGGKLVLSQDLPGVKLEDIEITTEKHALRINAKRGDDKLSYTYDVRSDWDLATTAATLVDGVLTVTIAKKELAPPPVNKVLVTRG